MARRIGCASKAVLLSVALLACLSSATETSAQAGRADAAPANQPVAQPTGIIVLGGGLHGFVSAERANKPVELAGERVVAGIRLAKQYPNATLLYAGQEEPPGALPVLLRAGLPASRLVVETRSRSTAENARFLAEMVQPKPDQRWILVTSADHMERALACFRTAGFVAEPHPVEIDPMPKHSRERSVHETLGSLAYRALGLCR